MPASPIDPMILTQALCTRLCHDLAGPIGAVSAGVELVGGDPAQVDSEMLQLLAGSSASAAQKLKFFRVALGTPATSSSLKDFKTIASGYLASVAGQLGPAAIEWTGEHAFDDLVHKLSGAATQVLANLIIIAIEVIPRLRKVIVSAAGNTISVEAQGEVSTRLDQRQDLIALLADPAAGVLSPKTVQTLYAIALVGQGGGRLTASAVEGGCRVLAHYEHL